MSLLNNLQYRLKSIFIVLILIEFSSICCIYRVVYADEKIDRFDENNIEKHNERGEYEVVIDDLIPTHRQGISLSNSLIIDLLIPGGGHFYTDNYYYGIAFGALKVLGGFSIYYSYISWKDKRSQYYISKQANENIDQDQEDVLLNDGSKTVFDYKRDYDKAAQQITFAVIANLSIYISSLIITYLNVSKINERAISTFEMQYGYNSIQNGEIFVFFKYNYRI